MAGITWSVAALGVSGGLAGWDLAEVPDVPLDNSPFLPEAEPIPNLQDTDHFLKPQHLPVFEQPTVPAQEPQTTESTEAPSDADLVLVLSVDVNAAAYLLSVGIYSALLFSMVAYCVRDAIRTEGAYRKEVKDFRSWRRDVENYHYYYAMADEALRKYVPGASSAEILIDAFLELDRYLDREHFVEFSGTMRSFFNRRPAEDLWQRFAKMIQARVTELEKQVRDSEPSGTKLRAADHEALFKELKAYAATLDISVFAESKGVYAYHLRRLLERFSDDSTG